MRRLAKRRKQSPKETKGLQTANIFEIIPQIQELLKEFLSKE